MKLSLIHIFASHYHELTVLEDSLRGLKNLNVAVSEKDGDVVFLHKIAEGSASKSYGIHVARLAGVPEPVSYTHLDVYKRQDICGGQNCRRQDTVQDSPSRTADRKEAENGNIGQKTGADQ